MIGIDLNAKQAWHLANELRDIASTIERVHKRWFSASKLNHVADLFDRAVEIDDEDADDRGPRGVGEC